ncbi:hypothetical protein KDI_53040 [Dictyobacter arantiisoli]|uniref:Transcription regulator HTH AraC N-terminal domain-containing protein n=1 Tax=Dictyobacter arantiisoli TaxID=2014874 RepID=A0A5A5TJE7_9CHLR|nr:AraC family transcriptional regulator [Dictyobacter arantiisoli]GCF11740.1 hypothetical protein KDI_53040 [Dictyobacter arantiisoli]
MVEVSRSLPGERVEARAIDVSPLDGNLLDAFVRLVRLLDAPADAQVLMPLIIIYWLLMGAQGAQLRHLALEGGYTSHITTAVKRLRQNFDQSLSIERFAQELDTSVSGFHHHFKAVTAMSPLQFQWMARRSMSTKQKARPQGSGLHYVWSNRYDCVIPLWANIHM